MSEWEPLPWGRRLPFVFLPPSSTDPMTPEKKMTDSKPLVFDIKDPVSAATAAPDSDVATKPAPAKRSRPSRSHKGSSLVPDLEKHRAAVTNAYWYWIGALPSCPTEHLDLKGIHFPKLEEQVIRDRDGDTQRVPVIGALVSLTESQVAMLADRLSRTVLRFQQSEAKILNSEGMGIEAVSIPPRVGFPVTIATPEETAGRASRGLPTRTYDQRPNDEPAARYLFAVPCTDQKNPARGSVYPQPLEETGLNWPADKE